MPAECEVIEQRVQRISALERWRIRGDAAYSARQQIGELEARLGAVESLTVALQTQLGDIERRSAGSEYLEKYSVLRQ